MLVSVSYTLLALLAEILIDAGVIVTTLLGLVNV